MKANQDFLLPRRNILVNKQLIKFKNHSKYVILILTKWTNKDFKIYSLYFQNYMINFMFSSKAVKISGLKRVLRFTDFFSMVIQLYRLLPTYRESNLFILYTDNFFTNVKLLKYICQYSIGTYEIAKAGSRFPIEILIFWDILTKKKD